jgi:subtilisin-like proprotein convertase family protein
MAEHSDEHSPGTKRHRGKTNGEFFSVGTPLHAVRAGYVRRRADDALYKTVVAGRYAHVIAPDHSGKTSLVAATSARLQNHGVKVAILDLRQISGRDAGDDPGRWYYSIAYRLLRQLRIRVNLQSWWQDRAILSSRQRLVEFYAEILLQNIQERIVVFVDEIQCIGELPFADQLLASIRAAHNARGTDPDFSRLSFVLLGECDPLSLIAEPTMSPFNVTQPITLDDFSRSELDLFATELQLPPAQAEQALDRIHYWTGGQPYLTQKLARAVSRESFIGDIAENIDRIAMHQLSGRAAVHNEPHMSHIHRAIVGDRKRREALLTLYGRIRKGIDVLTDLGSPLQRKLIAIGLVIIDEEGKLAIRNRLYEEVFTTRWANRNLPAHWRTPAIAAAVILAILAIPFWYTQLLPRGYVQVLTSAVVEPVEAEEAYLNYRSFPGHVAAADKLFRGFVIDRSESAADADEIEALATIAARLPDAGRLPDELRASYWDRQVAAEMRDENRDAALLAAIRSLVLSTPARRGVAASLVGDDYPLLLASLQGRGESARVFDRVNMIVTEVSTAQVSQWSLEPQGLQRRPDWKMTALEVSPLVRRVMVDRPGTVSRASLTLNLSHARVGDLRIKVIAPSGRTVEVDPGVERASSIQDLRISAAQLRELAGEPLSGTWSLSIRDEELGVAGRLVGWTLNLNSQGLVEDFQRGLNISDPVERATDNVWYSDDGRYAVARAMQSDSARIWDLAFAAPVRAVAVNENEQLIGVSRGARMLVTATQDAVHIWDTVTGDRVVTEQSCWCSGAAMKKRLSSYGRSNSAQSLPSLPWQEPRL